MVITAPSMCIYGLLSFVCTKTEWAYETNNKKKQRTKRGEIFELIALNAFQLKDAIVSCLFYWESIPKP